MPYSLIAEDTWLAVKEPETWLLAFASYPVFDFSFKFFIFFKKYRMKKINSEISVSLPNLKAKWGTIDKKCPSSLYLEVGGYITPKEDKDNYVQTIKKIDKEVKTIIKNAIISTDDICKEFIFVSDVSDTRISYGKKSYLAYQIHMGRKRPLDSKSFKDIVSTMNSQWSLVYEGIYHVIEENGFSCSKTKK